MNWLALGVAGLGGVYLRAAINQWAWPYWSTAFVNILGCFLMGVLVSSSQRWLVDYRPALAVGFLGGLTTFSGLAMDMYKFSQNQQWSQMAIYFALTHILGLSLLFAGLFVGQRV